MNDWIAPVWLILALTATIVFRRWIEMQLQGLVLLVTNRQGLAVWVFFLLFFPGILVHEISHWLMAKLLFVPTGRITLWPQVKRDGSVWLGSVEIGKNDPFRSSLIGLAPLLSGSVLVVLIAAHLRLDGWGTALLTWDGSTLVDAVRNSVALPDFWLWLYFLFAIANRMLPSPTDREPWKPVLIFLGVVAAVWLISGWTPQLSEEAQGLASGLVGFLVYAYSVTAAINLGVTVLLATAQGLVSVLLQRRITYRTR